MNRAQTAFLIVVVAWFAGCGRSDRGFTLPPGDAERGEAAFVKFRCFDCHEVYGVDLPPAEGQSQTIVELGGEVNREKEYADLVTGIINPSHRLAPGYAESAVSEAGKSRMQVYNDVMTVAELVDIVTFLQAHYKLREYEPTIYSDYHLIP